MKSASHYFVALAGYCCIVNAIAWAQESEPFYRGKTITVVVASEAGGGIDGYARLFAGALGKYVPGRPAVVVRNMPGAGSITGLNHVTSLAPQDGTVIGFVTRGVVLQPILGVSQTKFDPRTLQWIGSVSPEVSVGIVWSTSTPVRTIQDATKHDVVVASTGTNADCSYMPALLNRYVGTKFKIVKGYMSSHAQALAIERGEVQGKICGSWSDLNFGISSGWVQEGKVRVLVQMGVRKHRDLPDIPLAQDLADSDEGRQVMDLFFSAPSLGWPVIAGPKVPVERVQILRNAYRQALSDELLQSAARKANLNIDPIEPEELVATVERIYQKPPEIVARAREFVRLGH